MAKQSNNVVTYGLRGTIGDLLVFRQRDGKTVVSKRPTKATKVSEKQKAQRQKFQQGVLYGKAALADSGTKELYEAKAASKKRTPFNVAVADFLHAPDIENVDVSGYTGQPGDIIRVRVHDDFQVKQVTIHIIDAEGALVEEGNAQPDATGYAWIYVATQANHDLDGDKITITASDIPGNITQQEQTL